MKTPALWIGYFYPMMNSIDQILSEKFPSLQDTELLELIRANASIREIESDDILMDIGSIIQSVPMVVSGSIKVMREDEDGHELLLYYLQSGETCAMSLTCCMAFKRSEIRAVAQEHTVMLAIPVHFMDEWMVYRDWRSFVMNTYRMRFEELLEVLDSIAFLKMDERLWKYLQEKSASLRTSELMISHQDIAYDINSSREVVSRILKQMERKGMLKLGRNRIDLDHPV